MADVTRYSGFAEEQSYNDTTNIPQEEFHVDIASADLDIASSKNTTVPSGIGKGPRQKIPTFNYPEGSVEFPVDINTIGFFLKMTLGGYRFEPGEFNFQNHEFFGDSSSAPRSFITTVGKDRFEHLFTGCVVDSMELSFNEGVLMATVNIVGSETQRRQIKLSTDLDIPNGYPLAFHEGSVVIGQGYNIDNKIQELSITISNNPSTDNGNTIGSLHPTRIVTGDREVTVSYTLYFENEDELERYEDDEEFELRINFNSQEGGSMNIVFPRAYYDSVPTTVSGRDAITQSASVNTLVGDYELTTPIDDGSGTTETETVQTNIYVSLSNSNEEGY